MQKGYISKDIITLLKDMQKDQMLFTRTNTKILIYF